MNDHDEQTLSSPRDAGDPIPYATPAAPTQHGSRTSAGFALIAGGLGLIFLGGCFLIGVLILTQANQLSVMGFGEVFLLFVLYALAFACFIGGAILIVHGARGLRRLLRS